MGFLTFSIILALLIVGNAIIDWYRIERLKQSFTKKMYRVKTYVRAGIMIINAIILFLDGLKFRVEDFVVLVGLQSALFWILFDMMLNIMRGKGIDYVGKTASSDKTFNGNFTIQISIKLLYLALFIILLILRFS